MSRKRKGDGLSKKYKTKMQWKSNRSRISPPSLSPQNRTKHKRLRSSNPPLVNSDELALCTTRTLESSWQCYCLAIFYPFAEIMDAPHITFWKVKCGTISVIMKALQMLTNQQRVINGTLEEILTFSWPSAPLVRHCHIYHQNSINFQYFSKIFLFYV